jgi:ABC-type transport system involved in multi-copper enzyme maturation permease subunit
MTFGRIFLFEAAYQARRPATWLYLAASFFVGWSVIQGNYLDDARNGWMLLNAPLVVASTTVVGCLMWLFVGASVAGDAAARDVESGMHPLSYSAPVPKFDYLAGRFLAAYAINAVILLAAQAGMLLGMHWPDVEAEVLGPWRPVAFLLAFSMIALPNAFIATAMQFSFAALGRRPILSYFGSIMLFFASMGMAVFVATALHQPQLARLLDPVGMISIVSSLSDTWSAAEHNTRLVGPQHFLIANRLLWIAIGAAVLAFTYHRFRLVHPAEKSGRFLFRRRVQEKKKAPPSFGTAILAPVAQGQYGGATAWYQLAAVTVRSLRTLARGWTVIPPLLAVGILTCVVVTANMDWLGVPLVPRTEHVLTYLTAALANPGNRVWMAIPLLIIFYAGELVWSERDARMGEISGAAPVPDWVFFAGKFLALALLLAAWMLVLMLAGVIGQALLGYERIELGLYLKVMLGLQLADYLLFAVLALAVHTLVNHKQLGTLAALAVYGLIAFAPLLGLEHKLLVFGASPAWSYSDIRGFGASLAPWLAFKAYWAAWAVLLAVFARLAWVRGRESDPRARLRLVRERLTRPTLATAALAGTALLGLGGYVFYNTNLLNTYRPHDETIAQAAAYERAYARYTDLPQPRVVRSTMRVEIHPQRRAAEFRGSYQLVNPTAEPIDAVHVSLATGDGVQTRRVDFDRPSKLAKYDAALGYRIYQLATPLAPGQSMRLDYEVDFAPRGFGNRGADETIVANGSWISTANFLPAIGYQPARELDEPGDRLTQGLVARPRVPRLEDLKARQAVPGDVGIGFRAIVGTEANQVAVAPGVLRRSWSANGRRYFEYASDAPIREDVQFFSANYAVHTTRCDGVQVAIYHHPGHDNVVGDLERGACAALRLYASLWGPYPRSALHLVENAQRDIGAHSEPAQVDYGDGFARLDPAADPDGTNLVFAVAAHEVAHQWWGGVRLAPARVEGVGFLIESMATFSATQVVEKALGPDQLQAYLDLMRREYEVPRSLASPPLLRATEQFLNYRKGPLAMHALSQYVGRERVNLALRRFLDANRPGTVPLPTTLDLYRELQAVTPTRYQGLLHDLLASNTYWELDAEQMRSTKLPDGRWKVALDVRARKLVVDDAGAEIDQPLDEWVEVGLFPGSPRWSENGQMLVGKPMYLGQHRITRSRQTIEVIVAAKPGHAGIDPRALLVDLRPRDNFTPLR